MIPTIPDLCCTVSSLPNTYTKVNFLYCPYHVIVQVSTSTVLTKRSQKQHFTAQNVTVQECTVCLAANCANVVTPFTATASISNTTRTCTHTRTHLLAYKPHSNTQKHLHKNPEIQTQATDTGEGYSYSSAHCSTSTVWKYKKLSWFKDGASCHSNNATQLLWLLSRREQRMQPIANAESWGWAERGRRQKHCAHFLYWCCTVGWTSPGKATMQSVSADGQPSAPRISHCANWRSLFKGLFFRPLTYKLCIDTFRLLTKRANEHPEVQSLKYYRSALY